MKVVFLQSARTDLQELRRKPITRFGSQAWREALARIQREVGQLESFPHKSSIPPELAELGAPNYRQIVSGMCRIIYEINDQTISIHLVVDTRRDLKDVLAKRLLRP